MGTSAMQASLCLGPRSAPFVTSRGFLPLFAATNDLLTHRWPGTVALPGRTLEIAIFVPNTEVTPLPPLVRSRRNSRDRAPPIQACYPRSVSKQLEFYHSVQQRCHFNRGSSASLVLTRCQGTNNISSSPPNFPPFRIGPCSLLMTLYFVQTFRSVFQHHNA